MPAMKPRSVTTAMNERNISSISGDSRHNSQLDLKDLDPNTPYTCSGNFSRDFSELCRRQLHLAVIPPVMLRPSAPQATPPSLAGPASVTGPTSVAGPTSVDGASAIGGDSTPIEMPPKTFSICENRLKYFKPCLQVKLDSTAAAAANDLENLDGSTVAEIYIRGWKVDVPMLNILSQCFLSMSHLHTLNLWRAGLTRGSVESLADVLPQCPSLKTLILDNNPINCQPWYLLICSTARYQLQNLSLRYNGVSDSGVALLCSALSNDSIISSTVDLLPAIASKDKQPSAAGSDAAAEATAAEGTKTPEAAATDSEAAAATAAAAAPSMTAVDVAGLAVGNAETVSNSATVSEDKRNGECALQSLNLTGNNITDAGAHYLAKALRWNRTLTWLSLGSNQIGDSGAAVLAEVLSRFQLTHEEIVARRKLLLMQSLLGKPRPTASASSTNRLIDQKEKSSSSSSVRNANTSNKSSKATASSATAAVGKAKKDGRGGKEDDKSKGRSRDSSLDGRSSKKGSSSSMQQSGSGGSSAGGKKSGTGKQKKSASASDKSGDTMEKTAEVETHPLLGPFEHVGNGVLLMNGNLCLRSLNLFNNLIGDVGAAALVDAVRYQTTLIPAVVVSQPARKPGVTTSAASVEVESHTGLVRLNLQKNARIGDEALLRDLDEILTRRDPLLATSVSRSDVTSESKHS